MPFVLIDPQETLPYTHDWATYLDDAGSPSDTISTSEWSVTPVSTDSPTEPVLTNSSNTTTMATVCISNCRDGEVYRLVNKVTTNFGVVAERTISLRCGQR